MSPQKDALPQCGLAKTFGWDIFGQLGPNMITDSWFKILPLPSPIGLSEETGDLRL